jgi:monoterpene epsilon-lactone hydrolase
MPSQAMQGLIDALRDQQQASASQAPPALDERRAAFAPAGRLLPVPDDVLVRDVTAGGVPAHWLAAPGADTGRVLLVDLTSSGALDDRARRAGSVLHSRHAPSARLRLPGRGRP